VSKRNVLIFADWAFFQRTGREATLLPKMDQLPVQKLHPLEVHLSNPHLSNPFGETCFHPLKLHFSNPFGETCLFLIDARPLTTCGSQ
jgi:hypothetical protein